MGKRYTKEEISRIQTLTSEGHSDRTIAEMLDRTDNGVRNIRHRMKLKTEIPESLHSLMEKRRSLREKVYNIGIKITLLQTKKQDISKALGIEQQALERKLETALRRLKHEKPELFEITEREQIVKLTGQLIGSYIKYLISE